MIVSLNKTISIKIQIFLMKLMKSIFSIMSQFANAKQSIKIMTDIVQVKAWQLVTKNNTFVNGSPKTLARTLCTNAPNKSVNS